MSFPLEDDIPEPPQPFRVGKSDFDGQRHVDPDSGLGGEQPLFRPHAFGLTHGDGGAMIAYGELHYNVTIQNVTRTTVAGTEVVESITQAPIGGTKQKVPQYNGSALDPEIPNAYTQLDAYGDVYLYWEYEIGSGGVVSVCEIRVGAPTEEDVAYLNADLVRVPGDAEPAGSSSGSGQSSNATSCTGKFAIKIGRCVMGETIKQYVSSDVDWHVHVIEDDSPCDEGSSSSSSSGSSSSSSSSGSSSSSSSAGSSSGSGKDSCIVEASWWEEGYTSLHAVEAPGVPFIDFGEPGPTGRETIRAKTTKRKIDPRFVEVCEPGSLRVIGNCEEPVVVGFKIRGDTLTISKNAKRPVHVFWMVVGTRKGFHGVRFPQRTSEQFESNERFIQSAFPSFDEVMDRRAGKKTRRKVTRQITMRADVRK